MLQKMSDMIKNNKTAMLISNIAGMVSGILLGFAGACMIARYTRSRNNLRNRAKKAFRTIENTLSM